MTNAVNVAPETSLAINLVRTATGWDDTQPLPAWFAANTRVSRNSGTHSWAVNMRVPYGAALTYDQGIKLSDAFKIWYEVDVNVAPTGLVTYINTSAANMDFISVSDLANTSTVNWEDFNKALSSPDPMICARDVSIASTDVGTKNAGGPNRISLTTPNTLFAHPKNETMAAIGASQICAQFRIANWGTQPDWNDVSATPGPVLDQLWKPVSNLCPAGPTNPGPIAAGAKADTAGTNEIVSPWTLSAADRCEFIGSTGIPANEAPDGVAVPPEPGCATPRKRRLHQCMLVELSGGALTYSPSSVYRNMDFVNASTFTREAEVSVAALPDSGTPDRDVYLFVRTYNLPENVNSPDPQDPLRDVRRAQEIIDQPGPNDGQPNPNDDRRVVDKAVSSLPDSKVPPLGADFDTLNQLYPTYIVHSYRDTGTTTVRKGTTFKLLTPQTSFGYYINHEGDLSGWKHQLEGAQKIATDLYLIAVPQGGTKSVRTTIEAVEGSGFSWWWLLLLLLLLLIIWFLKRRGSTP